MFAQLAYKDPLFVATYNVVHNISDTVPLFAENRESGAQCYIFRKAASLYVAFRGTSELKDVLQDLDVRREPFMDVPGVLVHQGFLRQFMSIEPIITEYLKDTLEGCSTIYFIGHSLGSICTLAAVYYGQMFADKYIACHTFGSPRIGNSKFTQLFSQYVDENVRVVNTNDPVTMIPMSSRFRHVNESICIDDDHKVTYVRKDIPFWRRLISSVRNIDFFKPIADHDCELYKDRVNCVLTIDDSLLQSTEQDPSDAVHDQP
jgi:hypothetical protein